jgi:predicted membrane metal-binding protein
MKTPPKIPTDRSFGLTFAVVFTLVGAWLLWKGNRLAVPSFGVAAVFALLAFTVARVLHPLNVVWMHFGLLLNKIVSPVVMGVIFFLVFAPVGIFFRLTGRDALRRTFERDLPSYWIDRSPPGPDGKTLPRQF